MKLVQVFNEEDKNELMNLGYKFINQIKQKDLIVYQFINDNKLNFNKKQIKYKETKTMLF